MNWHDRREVKKGAIGEAIVDQWLRDRGVIPYKPIADGAHPFDRLIATKSKRIAVVDVKTKPARRYYPDTGMNVRHYNEYVDVSKRHRIRIFVAFVDEQKKEIYGQWLDTLSKPYQAPSSLFPQNYPWFDGPIVYFPLALMRPIANLPEDKVIELCALRQSNYDETP